MRRLIARILVGVIVVLAVVVCALFAFIQAGR
jgi:hypothetical protein